MPREQAQDQEVGAIESWLKAEPAEPPLFDDEERKQRDWFDLEIAAREFVKAYGPAAMVRCISEALR